MSAVAPLTEWQAEMSRRGKKECKFRCPRCGNEASPADFERAGADPQRAPQECIGRVDPAIADCDWCAFGLLGTLDGGREVDLGDRTIWVFDFAEAK